MESAAALRLSDMCRWFKILWQTLDALLQTHKVQFVWVKGHADNVYNNRCDALAVAQREKFA